MWRFRPPTTIVGNSKPLLRFCCHGFDSAMPRTSSTEPPSDREFIVRGSFRGISQTGEDRSTSAYASCGAPCEDIWWRPDRRVSRGLGTSGRGHATRRGHRAPAKHRIAVIGVIHHDTDTRALRIWCVINLGTTPRVCSMRSRCAEELDTDWRHYPVFPMIRSGAPMRRCSAWKTASSRRLATWWS